MSWVSKIGLIGFLGMLLGCPGCHCVAPMGKSMQVVGGSMPFSTVELDSGSAPSLQQIELVYASAVRQAANNCDASVDLYFQAAIMAWPTVEGQFAGTGQSYGRAAQLYEYSLAGLITSGQKFHRLDPRRGLQVQDGEQTYLIPISHLGFVRSPEEFDCLIPSSSCGSSKLENNYRSAGLGISTVVQHERGPGDQFRREKQSFAATAVLRPSRLDISESGAAYRFELFDPLRVRTTDLMGQQIPITRDPSAPIAYVLENQKRNYWEAFIHPGGTDSESALFMLEPYQPGKIPLVFVHGLLSDPMTWANMANELHARPTLLERYQIWGFEYSTGAPFLGSAADFREQLLTIQATFDPEGQDPALSQMILVGHSMGGLLAKLQVTGSGDTLWKSVANRPLSEVLATEQDRQRLARVFYFDPLPSVSRVIYMGTPHRGSPWAKRPIGRIGAKLVENPSGLEEEHRKLVCDNPGVFSDEFERRIPTSVDLLRPDSGLLLAMDRICVDPRVTQHSVIGSYRPMICVGDSDGVVPVASALRRGTESEIVVRSKHELIHRQPETVEELIRILDEHLQQIPIPTPVVTSPSPSPSPVVRLPSVVR